MKTNFVGLVAGLLAIAGLALPLFTVNSTSAINSTNMDFTVYLYQIQGTVNGVSATAFPGVWFVYGALALVSVSVICCFVGSFLVGRKGQLVLLVAGIMALMSMVTFSSGLLMSDYAVAESEPAAVMGFFQSNAFGITADQAMEISYSFVWSLGYGFWLTIVAAIVAFVGAVAPSLSKKAATVATTEPKIS